MTSTAALYSQVFSPQAEDGLKLIDRLSPQKGSRVLDLGCGTGYLASVLAERVGPGGKVTGVDPDGERIRLAREDYGNISNLEFSEGSGEDFPDGPYDFVFSHEVMHWIKDKEPVFQKVFQTLSVGGKFAICCGFTYAPVASQLQALMEPGKPKQEDRVHICPPDVYEAMASRCGFQIEFKAFSTREFHFPNIESLIEWIYASSSGQLDYHSIDHTTLKREFGDKPTSYDVKEVTYIFQKA